jgi:hypothetical protein
MRIGWILTGNSIVSEQAGVTSPLASYRYRVLIPMRELEARGHVCRLYELPPGAGTANHPALSECEALVFAKNHAAREDVAALLDHARVNGPATVVDICDDYFGPGEELAAYYSKLTGKADLVTVSTPRLATSIQETARAGACVICDPYEGPRGTVRFAPELPRLEALWFGTPLNLASLLRELPALAHRLGNLQLHLQVLTRECPGLVEAFRQMNSRNGTKLRLEFREWSLDRNWSALESCDLVVITVDQQPFFLAKGSNRLVEALRAGRFAVVQPLPAYQEFSDWAWVGPDIGAALEWAATHPGEVLKKIAAGQAYIEQTYSPAVISVQWEHALHKALKRRQMDGQRVSR